MKLPLLTVLLALSVTNGIEILALANTDLIRSVLGKDNLHLMRPIPWPISCRYQIYTPYRDFNVFIVNVNFAINKRYMIWNLETTRKRSTRCCIQMWFVRGIASVIASCFNIKSKQNQIWTIHCEFAVVNSVVTEWCEKMNLKTTRTRCTRDRI